VPQRCRPNRSPPGARRHRRAGLRAVGRAQSFPSKPIKVLIGVPAGGTQDVLTRAIADSVRASLGPLIIDNRSGAPAASRPMR
jgi:tripartite-type tricarboxylate transporter receptor subunit TctC